MYSSHKKPGTAAASKAREPPPFFRHPSPSASHASLPGTLAAGAAVPSTASTNTTKTKTHQSSNSNNNSNNNNNTAASPTSTTQKAMNMPASSSSLARQNSLLNPRGRNVASSPPPPPSTHHRLQADNSSRPAADKTDALWAEMQATLEEVELSASGATHVFGPEHDRKLAELRAAQIALAQAWARSEADEAIETTAAADQPVRDLKGALAHVALSAAAGAGPGVAGKMGLDGTDPGRSTAGTGSARPASSGHGGADKLGTTLEEETQTDILLARQRREANDRYFSRVDQGVRDVVDKLEAVSVAMKAVEQESRDVWGEESASDNAKA